MAEGGCSTGDKAIARAVVYRFMSYCLVYPDAELIELFDGPGLEEFLHSWRYLGFDAAEDATRITDWLRDCDSRDAALEELQREYTRLFVNACPRVVAPPYSSIYLNGQRRVWGTSTAEVAKLYEAVGLGMSRQFHDIPDHIAAEFEFASYLIVQQIRGADNSTTVDKLADVENRFLSNHLLRWAPAFLALVIESARLTFYRMVASLARQFLEQEAERFPLPGQGAAN